MSYKDIRYDHAIIGSGISGLICAAYLSRKGKKVIVLEKNHQIGGCLQVFSRDKKIFDTGVHYIGGLGNDHVLKRLLDFIGIGHKLKFEQLNIDGFDKIVFENDQTSYLMPQGWDNLVEKLGIEFPQEKAGLTSLVKDILDTIDLFGPYNLEELSEDSLTLDVLKRGAFEVINKHIKDPKLIAVLGGNSLLYCGDADTTPFYVFALIVNSYVEGAYRMVNGSSQISKFLSGIIHEQGGSIQKYAEVHSIVMNEGRVETIHFGNGGKLNTGQCIAGIHPERLLDMIPAGHLRSTFGERIRSLKNGNSFISVYFSIKPNVLPYFNHNIYVLKDTEAAWNADPVYDESWPKSVLISTGCEEKNQQFCNTVNVLAYCDYELFRQWEDSFNTTAEQSFRGSDYELLKEELIEKMIKKVEGQIPGFREMYFSIYSSTPLTYRDFINAPGGTAYGIEKDHNDPLYSFVSAKTKIPNLLLTGQSTDLHGVYGASISALLTLQNLEEGKDIFHEIREFNSGW